VGVTPRPRLVMHAIPGINGRLTTNNCRLRMRWQNRTPPAHTIKIRRPISLPSAHYETVSPNDCRHATYANRSISLLVAPYRIRFKQYLVGDCPHFCTRDCPHFLYSEMGAVPFPPKVTASERQPTTWRSACHLALSDSSWHSPLSACGERSGGIVDPGLDRALITSRYEQFSKIVF
jgi:hypothetical protein